MKTKEEKRFDKLLDKYFETFEQNYPLEVTSLLSTEEHISRIEKAIESNKPVIEEHEKGRVY